MTDRISVSYDPKQYPLLAKFVESCPPGHRSARVCEMLEEVLDSKETLAEALGQLIDGQGAILARLDNAPDILSVDHAISADVISNLLDLGQ